MELSGMRLCAVFVDYEATERSVEVYIIRKVMPINKLYNWTDQGHITTDTSSLQG